jgi:hypothetical protein
LEDKIPLYILNIELKKRKMKGTLSKAPIHRFQGPVDYYFRHNLTMKETFKAEFLLNKTEERNMKWNK